MYYNLQLSYFFKTTKNNSLKEEYNTNVYKIRQNCTKIISAKFTSISNNFTTDCPILFKQKANESLKYANFD